MRRALEVMQMAALGVYAALCLPVVLAGLAVARSCPGLWSRIEPDPRHARRHPGD